MEKILVQILDELKDVKVEMRSLKEENREEHKAMKQDIIEIKSKQEKMQEDIVKIKDKQEKMEQDIVEIKDKQEKMEQDIVEIKEEQKVIKEKVEYNKEVIQKMTKDIVDSIDIIKRTVTRINNNQIGEIRHIMLQETVNFEKTENKMLFWNYIMRELESVKNI